MSFSRKQRSVRIAFLPLFSIEWLSREGDERSSVGKLKEDHGREGRKGLEHVSSNLQRSDSPISTLATTSSFPQILTQSRLTYSQQQQQHQNSQASGSSNPQYTPAQLEQLRQVRPSPSCPPPRPLSSPLPAADLLHHLTTVRLDDGSSVRRARTHGSTRGRSLRRRGPFSHSPPLPLVSLHLTRADLLSIDPFTSPRPRSQSLSD